MSDSQFTDIVSSERQECRKNASESMLLQQNKRSNSIPGIIRSRSLSSLEDHINQCPALPRILAAASKAKGRQIFAAQMAAIRAATSNVRRPRDVYQKSSNFHRRAGTPSRNNADGTDPPIQGLRPFGSGPLLAIAGPPAEDHHIPNRSSPDPDNGVNFLIRTDMRYSRVDDTVTVLMELPGLTMKDVTLKLATHSTGIRNLYVAAIARRPSDFGGEFAMQERVYGRMTRTLIVPPHVKACDIDAQMQDGILRMKIPGTKFEEVEIRGGSVDL